ncbi:MAG TPA: hypothetical protein VIM61_12210 [Chthoniobacterales bacterium]|jgi:hypothetical protein
MSYNKRILEMIEAYRREVADGALNPREIAAYLIRAGKWEPSLKEAMSILSEDISDAMRTQYAIDSKGRRVRRKHSVRHVSKDANGNSKQMVLWYDIEIAPPQFMFESFQQRRGSIADDCWQLKQDVDSYNENYNKAAPIQIMLDFTDDMADRQADLEDGDSGAKAA